MPSEDLSARVFISCGQRRDTEEEAIAEAVAERLAAMGFSPYVAVREQTLRGVKENIFRQLRTSEYLVFIDFAREALAASEPPVFRGSLFSHQELAIASFRDIEVLAFQEQNVRTDDGIIGFIQANCHSFTERGALPDLVEEEVRRRVGSGEWQTDWRAQLCQRLTDPPFVDAHDCRINEAGRYFHVGADNLHRETPALNCYAYIESIVDCATGDSLPVETVELKWAGTTIPGAAIAPGQSRRFDAVWVRHRDPLQAQFNVIWADSTNWVPRFRGPGDFEIAYLVSSETFPPARCSWRLHLDAELDLVQLSEV